MTQFQCNLGRPANNQQNYSLCPPPTPTPSGTPTLTPAPTPTPCTNYNIVNGNGVLVPGTTDIGNHCDDCNTSIALPFPVSLYGNLYTTALAGSNGYLALGTPYNFFYSGCLPNANFTYTIFPFEVDQITAGPGGHLTLTTGVTPNRNFYIEWRACQPYNGATTCSRTGAPATRSRSMWRSFFIIVYGSSRHSRRHCVGAIGVQGATGVFTQTNATSARKLQQTSAYRCTAQLPPLPQRDHNSDSESDSDSDSHTNTEPITNSGQRRLHLA